jgi:hypothetical protein
MITTLNGIKITTKQRKFFSIYARTLNATEAAMQTYNCKNRDVANALGAETLRKLSVPELLEAVGLTDENLAQGIREGRDATKPIVFKGELRAIPDHAIRHKYIETSLRLKKKLVDKVELTGEDGEPLRIEAVAGIGFIAPHSEPVEKV